MLDKTRKRFYKSTGLKAVEGGFAVTLDGRVVKTPAGRQLAAPNEGLGQALAAEWEAQKDSILPDTMPLTQLVSTALDRVGPERPAITEQMLKFAETDLLCYRADQPEELARRQQEGWQPLLDWAAASLDAPLLVTTGLLAIAQPPASLAALKRYLDRQDVWRLTAGQAACAAAGSLVLAVAMLEGRLDGGQVFALSALDETFQMERWGEDWEAAERRQRLQGDIASAFRLPGLL